MQSIRVGRRIRAWPTSSTRRVLPASPRVSSSHIKTSSLTSNQIMSDYFPVPRKCPAGTDHCRVVAALLSRLGVDARNLLPSGDPTARGVTEPGVVLATTSPLDAVACQQSSGILQRTQSRFRLGGAKNIRRTTWPGMISGTCWRSINGSERIHPATIARFIERFARFNLSETRHTTVLRTRGGNGVRGDFQGGTAAQYGAL